MTETQLKQIKLAAFGACNKYGPDGALGGAYTNAIKLFQEKVMGVDPDGVETPQVTNAIDDMYRNDFVDNMPCKCGRCPGFGNGAKEGEYRDGKPHIEAYYQYEYPSISLMTQWASFGIAAMFPEGKWYLTCGYRCHEDNKIHGRSSTNHMGKAIDICPIAYESGEPRAEYCDYVRKELVAMGTFQNGWAESNKLALEPSKIAPTWVHLDCRQFARKHILAAMG